jgi:hypothetical protein
MFISFAYLLRTTVAIVWIWSIFICKDLVPSLAHWEVVETFKRGLGHCGYSLARSLPPGHGKGSSFFYHGELPHCKPHNNKSKWSWTGTSEILSQKKFCKLIISGICYTNGKLIHVSYFLLFSNWFVRNLQCKGVPLTHMMQINPSRFLFVCLWCLMNTSISNLAKFHLSNQTFLP